MFHVKHRTTSLPDVSRETWERLELYAALIHRWSSTVNLVARNDLSHLHERHIVDSLQLLPLLPGEGTLLDIGSGAGFPGLVLAIASHRAFTLVESDQRKAAFLREAARQCGAQVSIYAARVESLTLPPAAAITARALAPLPQLLKWSYPHLAQTGICLFMKGRSVEPELTQAAAEWHMRVERHPSQTGADAVILQLSEIRPNAQR